MLPKKASFEEYRRTCTPLLKIPDFEADVREKVHGIVRKLLDFQHLNDPVENVISFMRHDLDFLKVILRMTNLSQEKFRRIIAAGHFYRGEYEQPDRQMKSIHSKVRHDDEYALEIAKLLLNANNNQVLVEHVADFLVDQIMLPENWIEPLQDFNMAAMIVRGMLAGEYYDKRGDAVEKIVELRVAAALKDTGVGFEKGQVPFLGKEVDVVVPSLVDPIIMVMISYMETTAGSQTQRKNEQVTMFSDVNTWNERNDTNKVFINVVDGGGWLARGKDLRSLHRNSHYCLSLNMLDQLDDIVDYHLVDRTKP